MPKIKTNLKFKNLKGDIINTEEFQGVKKELPLTLGLVLAEIILATHENKKGFRPLKSYELAKKLYGEDAKEIFEVDNADFIQIKELVENSQQYVTLIIAQAIQMLDEFNKK